MKWEKEKERKEGRKGRDMYHWLWIPDGSY
jgi:hypothetical protein